MATCQLDYVDFRPAGEVDEKGWLTIERGARVTNVSGTGTQKLKNALRHVQIPDIGDEHPTIAGMRVTKYSPSLSADSADTVDVRIIYERKGEYDDPDYTDVEVGSSVTQADTNKDHTGTLLTATYTPTGGGPTVTSSPTLPKYIPQTTVTYSRTESSGPLTKSKNYVGKMNSGAWAGGAAKTWLCTGIVGRSSDGGRTWRVTYTFEYKSDTWDGEWFYFAEDGHVPSDVNISTGNGYLLAQIYQTANFGSLNVT